MIEKFLGGSKVVVRAPAGCGKTHLLVEAVFQLEGRQLILTHTNAGVKELRTRLDKKQVKAQRYNLRTIDAFAFSYVAAYPASAGVKLDLPTGKDWEYVKEGFLSLIKLPFVREVISASYTGLVVDEYQDCSLLQHEIVLALSEILPTRIVGDPMQAIFDFGTGRNAQVDWTTVEESFDLAGELAEPHRWSGSNVDLGRWITESRIRLQAGGGLKKDSAISLYRNSSRQDLMSHLLSVAKKHPDESIAVIFPKSRKNCWKLAGSLKNQFQVLEDADCIDLVKACVKLDSHIAQGGGPDLLASTCDLIRACTAKLPSQFSRWEQRISVGKSSTTRDTESLLIISAMVKVRDVPTVESVRLLFEQCNVVIGLRLRSREMWTTFQKALRSSSVNPEQTLENSVRELRHRERLTGRKPPFRCLSTTLLLKGLEFDRVVIPDYKEFQGLPKHLYVAISRAKMGLDIFILDDK